MRAIPKILIVDDEPDILRLMEAGMKAKGYDVLTAKTGFEAIEKASKTVPDLILLDIVLPDRSGMEVCREIKSKIGAFVPIILVTVKKDIESKVTGIDHGADDFLTKPFHIEELQTKVRSMLRIKNLYDQLEKTAITDGLTGLYNRRFFLLRLHEECERSRRTGKPFSCLMFDLDHFKKINDTYGHACGDLVLQQFATQVSGSIRKTDILARFGGEEFILIFPETPVEKAAKMAEFIRKMIETETLLFQGQTISVTCSIGVCGFPSHGIQDDKSLLCRLDDMLYRAKRHGRNRVNVYDNPHYWKVVGHP